MIDDDVRILSGMLDAFFGAIESSAEVADAGLHLFPGYDGRVFQTDEAGHPLMGSCPALFTQSIRPRIIDDDTTPTTTHFEIEVDLRIVDRSREVALPFPAARAMAMALAVHDAVISQERLMFGFEGGGRLESVSGKFGDVEPLVAGPEGPVLYWVQALSFTLSRERQIKRVSQ